MANENRGHITCAFCNARAWIREQTNARGEKSWYYFCDTCGLVQPRKDAWQEWILTHGTIWGPDGDPGESPKPDEPPTPKPEPAEVIEPDTSPAPPLADSIEREHARVQREDEPPADDDDNSYGFL